MPTTVRHPARVGVLLAAGAAPWEKGVLEPLAAPGPVALVKRCLDLSDLLGTAAAGTAQVAVVSDRLPGLDADSIDRLGRCGLRVLVVTGGAPAARGMDDEIGARTRLRRMGVARVLDAAAVGSLVQEVLAVAVEDPAPEPAPEGIPAADGLETPASPDDPADLLTATTPRTGRLVAVWGPTGAPGRTTVAIAVAAEAAAAGRNVTLLDADPYGGAVSQHLAVLEDVSGLLAAARLANTGQLDRHRFVGLARQVAPGLRLVTGLPRPDRWTEVRAQAFDEVLTLATALDDLVVVDTGFGLPSGPTDPFAGPARDDMTQTTLTRADDVVVVASADPVGLTRLARSLRDLLELRPQGRTSVVVNRMRPSLGWSQQEVVELVTRVAPGVGVWFLPEDRAATDRALVAGRTLTESGDSTLRRAIAALAHDLFLVPDGSGSRGRARRRRGGDRRGRQTVSSR